MSLGHKVQKHILGDRVAGVSCTLSSGLRLVEKALTAAAVE